MSGIRRRAHVQKNMTTRTLKLNGYCNFQPGAGLRWLAVYMDDPMGRGGKAQ